MSNLVSLRTAAEPGAGAVESEPFISKPPPHGHAVWFYESDSFLFDTVGRFLATGLRVDDGLVIIATASHREGIVQRLDGMDVARAQADGRLTLLDARETLSRFMVGDMPDAGRFHDVIDRVIRRAREGRRPGRIRAYGEMVDLLWKDGNSRGAIRLEELWNDAGKAHTFSLLCAYAMGNFYREGDAARLVEVCRAHDHVIPGERSTDAEDSVEYLGALSSLQQRARSLESEIRHRRLLEEALRDALRERGRVEEELRACVKRETEARERAEASDSFKDMLMGILGHDLRNPLNTVLTTAHMMQARGDGGPDNGRRIDRIVSSGARMQRMIEQLLDVASARLTDGIPVNRIQAHDLVPLVAKIVEEARAGNPERAIEVRVAGPCPALIDPDRFEQVVSNLVGNAITHGDPAQPVVITIAQRSRAVSLAVCNFGKPIEPDLLPTLFDPFRRGNKLKGRSFGLGLGLYIVERIVTGHGGTITVASSAEAGTRFEVVLPQ
jgi:signal transduction histidine kinase